MARFEGAVCQQWDVEETIRAASVALIVREQKGARVTFDLLNSSIDSAITARLSNACASPMPAVCSSQETLRPRLPCGGLLAAAHHVRGLTHGRV